MEQPIHHSGQSAEPFKNVVVGIDEHQGGRDAVVLANELLASDGTLTVAHVSIRDSLLGRNVSTSIDPAVWPPGHEPEAAARDQTWDGVPVRRVDSPSVGRGLHELVDSVGADLLVVGSCRRGLLGRVMIGDATSDALNGAPCPIAIAPFGYAERPATLGEIGVGYNGSPESDDALAMARALAAEHGARLSGFEAVMIPSYLTVPSVGAVVDSLPALVQQALDRIAALGDVEPHAAYGNPAEELAVYSASLDLLIVGSRGYGPVHRLVNGSTSRALGRTARCPLLVLTRNARAQLPRDQAHASNAPVAVTIS